MFCETQDKEWPGPKPAQTQQVGPALPALNPFVRSALGKGQEKQRGTAAEMQGGPATQSMTGSQMIQGTLLLAESKSSGARDELEGRRVKAEKPGLLTWGPH